MQERSLKNKWHKGQAVAEFSIIAPLLLLFIFGLFETGMLLFGVGTAQFATVESARVEAQAANNTSADQLAVKVVQSSALETTQVVSVKEIDIYKVNLQPNGTWVPDNTKMNRYKADGTPISTTWPAGSRGVKLSNLDNLGVTIKYKYSWKTAILASVFAPLDMQTNYYTQVEPQSY